jgi:hypothetical protein
MKKPAYLPPPQSPKTKSSLVLVLFVMLFGAAVITIICETNGRHLCTKGSSYAATKNPTQHPTFSPTPLETNPPKPDFAEIGPALQAKIDAVIVVANPLLLTSSPTVKPTPHPTVKVQFYPFQF